MGQALIYITISVTLAKYILFPPKKLSSSLPPHPYSMLTE